MTIKIYNTDAREISETLARLAQFDPTCKDEYGNQVIDYLVLDALAIQGPLMKVIISDVMSIIKDTFHLSFEIQEIDVSARRLEARGMLIYHKEESEIEKAKLQILQEAQSNIEENRNRVQELNKKVLEEWEKELIKKYKEYPIVQDKIELIVEKLLLFTTKMFTRHGIESVAILYPTEDKTKEWISEIKGSILEDLPQIDPFIDVILKIEIPKFFKDLNSHRRAYITNLFNSSFMWHLIQVDEKCSKLLKDVTQGQKLFLDNNILYSLVGLDGANMLDSIHSILKLANKLGYELWVTTKTVDEFHGSLKWRMREFKQKPPVPAEMARIALDNLEKDNFLALYWSEFVENGTSVEEFVTEKSHLEDILKGLAITQTDEYRIEIEKSEELSKEKSMLRSVVMGEISEHIVEHDAFHRIFINKIRKTQKHHFNDAVAWFLTNDGKLPVYDRKAKKAKSSLPFCLTGNQWVQINRPLLVRTSDEKEYEDSFQVIVTQPFLRAMASTFSLDNAYSNVLSRLARYKNMSKQMVLNVVADKHFMISMASESDEKKIDEKIETKFVDITKQLQLEKKKLEENVLTKKKKIGKLEETVDELKEGFNNISKTYGDQARELKEERQKRETSEKKLKNFSNITNWGSFLLVLVLVSISLWLHELWLEWIWFESHTRIVFLKIISQLLFIFILLNIPMRKHWTIWLVISIALVICLFTIAAI